MRERRLCCFGHAGRFSGADRTAGVIQIDGRRGTGRPELTWKKLIEKDCREWKLATIDPQERSTWRLGVISAKRAASQLPGKGPADVGDAHAPACYQKSDYNDMRYRLKNLKMTVMAVILYIEIERF